MNSQETEMVAWIVAFYNSTLSLKGSVFFNGNTYDNKKDLVKGVKKHYKGNLNELQQDYDSYMC
jgi:hypothetical protein